MDQILVLSLITFGLIINGAAFLNPTLIILSFPFFLYLLSGLINNPTKPNIIISRRLSSGRVIPGQDVTISLTIKNLGPRIDAMLIYDKLPPQINICDGFNLQIINLPSKGSYSWSYTITGQRGFYPFHEIFIETRSFLGLIPDCQKMATNGELLILPRIQSIPRIPIRPPWTRVYSGEIPSRSGGHGTDFFGIRQYQPGDSPNWINWRASARHPSTLFSNEFEQDKVSDVGIILDGREKVNLISEDISIYEYSVQAAATLSAVFINQGDRVGLLKYGDFLDWILPGYGKYQLEKILRALSKAKTGRSLIFSYLEYIPTQLFPPKSQIVLISPLAQNDLNILLKIRAKGYQLIVISPNPISYEKESLPTNNQTDLAARILQLERKLLMDKLLKGGVQVLDWNVSDPFQQVVNLLQNSRWIPRNTLLNI